MSKTTSRWLEDLKRDGFVVIPNVIPVEACESFREASLEWLEQFPYGFKRQDKATWDADHLPAGATGGLYNRYAVNHESFVWDIRTSPGIARLYSEIYGTDELVSSFDGMNVSLPLGPTNRRDLEPTKPWPHIDQPRSEIGACQLYQGIASLSDSGPDDGGLVVMSGSPSMHALYEQEGRFRHEQEAPHGFAYRYRIEDLDWYKEHGCKVVKVCSQKGDFIIWDSRTIHWNASPVGDRIRFATYVAMAPKSFMTTEALQKKLEVFRARKGTTGYAYRNDVPEDRGDEHAAPRRPNGDIDPCNRSRPVNEPKELPEVMKLVGVH